MTQAAPEALYPILLSHATPAAVERLLIDAGVPVLRVHDDRSNRMGFENSEPESTYASFGIRDRAEFDFADRFQVRHAISWQDLLPAGTSSDAIEAELSRSAAWAWREAGIEIRESIVRTPIGQAVIERLKQHIIAHGVPWIRLAPWPAGYDGAFNFRFDLDEPELADWKRVVRIVDAAGIEPGVTWFLCTRAAEKIPESISLLAGREVQSHGHWHHVHADDPGLNGSNVASADKFLRNANFRPTGFAAPGGRIVPDLAQSLISHGYRYLAGLADVSGTPVRTSADGLHHIHALPVCEGAFLEAGIDSVETIVAGYLAAAGRAISRDRPVFWFGHPDRRLGRKPEILEELLQATHGFGRLWHVGLGHYADWFQARNRMNVTVHRSPETPGQLILTWHSQQHCSPAAAIWVEAEKDRWAVACASPHGQSTLNLAAEVAAAVPRPVPEPDSWPVAADSGWRSRLRTALDWERETPVAELRGGPAARRVKGWLRRATDSSWQARFEPLAWPGADPSEERAA